MRAVELVNTFLLRKIKKIKIKNIKNIKNKMIPNGQFDGPWNNNKKIYMGK